MLQVGRQGELRKTASRAFGKAQKAEARTGGTELVGGELGQKPEPRFKPGYLEVVGIGGESRIFLTQRNDHKMGIRFDKKFAVEFNGTAC